MKARLQLKPEAVPVFRQKRLVPYAIQPAVEHELNRLVKLGILTPVVYSERTAPIVVVKKGNGTIRLCADFSTGLNAALDVHQFPLPNPKGIFATLNGTRVFSHIDLSDAYFQIELDNGTRKLLVINTHLDFFQYNKLAFGVSSAPAIFQQTMSQVIAGLPGVAAHLDDIFISANTRSENINRFCKVFKKLQLFGSAFKKRKYFCTFFSKLIKVHCRS